MIPLFQVTSDVEESVRRFRDVMESGYIGEGHAVQEFEARLKSAWDCDRDVLAVNSCTSALQLALHLCDVKGRYVITTPNTCTATNTAIKAAGGIIVWADIDQFSGNICPQSIERIMRQRAVRTDGSISRAGMHSIGAIVCVDWGGSPCDYDELRKVARGLPIIEDAAHAYLTEYKGRHISNTGGDYVCFSFQAIKHLTTVDGGAIVVPPEQYDRARLLKWYGLDRKSSSSFRCAQTVNEAGFKYHMNNVNASIGLANMGPAADGVHASRGCAKYYSETIEMGNGVRYVPTFDDDSSYWIYTILVNRRDEFIQYMADHDVSASPVHARNDKHPCFTPRVKSPAHRAGIDYFSAYNVCIPCGHWVSANEAVRIAELVNVWNKEFEHYGQNSY